MVEFQEVFGNVDWNDYYVDKETAKEWFEEHKEEIESARTVWTDLKVDIISAVSDPADFSSFVSLKSEDAKDKVDMKEIKFMKADDERQVAKAPAMVPVKDKENDMQPPWVVVEAAHQFMKNKNTDEVDKEHETPLQWDSATQERGFVAESYTLDEPKEFETVNGDSVSYPKDTWMVEVKFTDSETWAEVKSGEITGYSIHGDPEYYEVDNKEIKQGQSNNDIMEQDKLVESLEQALENIAEKQSQKEDPCWDGYVQVGMKPDPNGDGEVPNCVPEDEVEEQSKEDEESEEKADMDDIMGMIEDLSERLEAIEEEHAELMGDDEEDQGMDSEDEEEEDQSYHGEEDKQVEDEEQKETEETSEEESEQKNREIDRKGTEEAQAVETGSEQDEDVDEDVKIMRDYWS